MEKTYFTYPAYIILYFFILITLISLYVPLSPRFPAAALDPSWGFGLNQAVVQHLQFGKDIIFTYGPYATISTYMYTPTIYPLMIGASLYLCCCFFLSFIIILNKQSFLGCIFLLITLILCYPVDVLFSIYPLITALSIAFLLIDGKSKIHPVLSSLSIAVLFSGFGLLILIKGTLLILCAPIILFSAGLLFVHKKTLWASIALLAPCFSSIIFWKLSAQPGSIMTYLTSLIYIVSGYSDAMSSGGAYKEIFLFLLSASLLIIAFWLEKFTSLTLKYFMLFCFSLFLFLSFKEGFVRNDAHALVAAYGLLAVAACSLFFISLPGTLHYILRPLYNTKEKAQPIRGYIHAYLIISSLSLSLFSALSIIHDYQKIDGFNWLWGSLHRNYVENWHSLENRLANPSSLHTTYQNNLATLKQQANFPIWKGTTDIYSYNQSLLLASGNAWSPRPIFQSYSAYTPELAELNKAHLLGKNAPDHIIFKISPIDNRLPALEDGTSWPVLLSQYTLNTQHNDFLFLDKKENCDFVDTMTPIMQQNISLRRWVSLPTNNHLLYAQIGIQPSFMGKILGLLYKPPQLTITIKLTDGSERKYRFIKGMAESGFILSPFVENTDDFSKLYAASSELQNKRIEKMKISVGKRKGIFLEKTYFIKISEFNPKQSSICK